MSRISYYLNACKRLLRETPIEVLLLASLGGLFGTLYRYNIESDKDKVIPLGFSEIEQIELDAASMGIKVPAVTHFLASTNDMTMKVFECWNTSHEQTLFGSNTRAFATELENRIEPSFKIYQYEIREFAQVLPSRADSALKQLAGHVAVRHALDKINDNFRYAWEDYHDDSYRPEVRTRLVTDADGNTDTEIDIVMVYDHTDHTYRYHKNYGEQVSRTLDDMLSEHPQFDTEKFMVSSSTHAENEYAIEASRKKLLKGKRLSPSELLEYANRWAYGSTITIHSPRVDELLANLHDDNARWMVAKKTAKSTAYRTYSHGDPGPAEFQTAETALSHGVELYTKIDAMVGSVEFVRDNTPLLYEKIRRFIRIVYDREEGDAERLKGEILDLAKQMYRTNFTRGFDVEPFKPETIVLYGIAGLALGGLVGFGLDYAGRKRAWYDRRED